MNLEEKLRKVFENPNLKDVSVDIIIKTNNIHYQLIRLGNNPKPNIALTINIHNEIITCFKNEDESNRGLRMSFSADGNEFNAIMYILKQWLYGNAGIKLD